MKTNYQNLNLFETLTILMITIGISLVLIVGFSVLNHRQQQSVADALQVFDIHEQVGMTIVQMGNAYQLEDKLFNDFYVAFTQVTSIDPATVQQQVAMVTTAFNLSRGPTASGRVAG